MGHSAVSHLAADDNVQRGHDDEENCDAPPGCPAILNNGDACANAMFRERYSDGDQQQAQEKNDWDGDEDQEANVGIAHMPPHVCGQDEQPGAAGHCD